MGVLRESDDRVIELALALRVVAEAARVVVMDLLGGADAEVAHVVLAALDAVLEVRVAVYLRDAGLRHAGLTVQPVDILRYQAVHEAEHFVDAAEAYDIDWRLVAAIGFIESTGGKFACKTADYSAFGWGSCKIDFDSYAESIDVISMNLGGHNPKTARYYAGKDVRRILWSYNPDTIRAGYGDMVINQMEIIASQQV